MLEQVSLVQYVSNTSSRGSHSKSNQILLLNIIINNLYKQYYLLITKVIEVDSKMKLNKMYNK
jgi:hypothetical protein